MSACLPSSMKNIGCPALLTITTIIYWCKKSTAVHEQGSRSWAVVPSIGFSVVAAGMLCIVMAIASCVDGSAPLTKRMHELQNSWLKPESSQSITGSCLSPTVSIIE